MLSTLDKTVLDRHFTEVMQRILVIVLNLKLLNSTQGKLFSYSSCKEDLCSSISKFAN